MESSNVETRSQFLRRSCSQVLDLELAHLVGKRLPWPHYVTVYFDCDVVFGLRSILLHEIDRLLAAPAKSVHPGIYDEPASSPHLVSELAKPGVRIRIEPHLGSEALCV